MQYGSRLGPLGFLVQGSGEDAAIGNYGIQDQVRSLEWIKENIRTFGGDANKVTIYGQSAGAESIGVLMTSPYVKNRDIFQQCIMQSNPFSLPFRDRNNAMEYGGRFAEKAGCVRGDMDCLRKLTTDEIALNAIDAENPEISDYNTLPHTGVLAERWKSCLQEGEEIPTDFTQMFDKKLFKMDITTLPKVLKGYEDMHVKHEPLTLIAPNFDTPLPPLQPAVFPPEFKDLDPPALDLFDLDECYSSEKVRLAQITNKCNEDDLEYYVRECGDILGVTPKLGPNEKSAKHVLEFVFKEIVEYKKLNRERDYDDA